VFILTLPIQPARPAPGLIHHSDHGSQYTSLAFSQRLQEAGILGSMGSVGDALDNAIAESFFATFTDRVAKPKILADPSNAALGDL